MRWRLMELNPRATGPTEPERLKRIDADVIFKHHASDRRVPLPRDCRFLRIICCCGVLRSTERARVRQRNAAERALVSLRQTPSQRRKIFPTTPPSRYLSRPFPTRTLLQKIHVRNGWYSQSIRQHRLTSNPEL